MTTGVNTILISVLTDSDSLQTHLPEKVVAKFCGESLALGNYLVSYADSYLACDPKVNCPFFQKGNCPKIDCPFIHPLSKLLCANWKFQDRTFPGAVLYLNFSCPERQDIQGFPSSPLQSHRNCCHFVTFCWPGRYEASTEVDVKTAAWVSRQMEERTGDSETEHAFWKRQHTMGSHMWCWVIWHCKPDSWVEYKSWMFC